MRVGPKDLDRASSNGPYSNAGLLRGEGRLGVMDECEVGQGEIVGEDRLGSPLAAWFGRLALKRGPRPPGRVLAVLLGGFHCVGPRMDGDTLHLLPHRAVRNREPVALADHALCESPRGPSALVPSFRRPPSRRRWHRRIPGGCAPGSMLCGDEPPDGGAFGALTRLFRQFLETV